MNTGAVILAFVLQMVVWVPVVMKFSRRFVGRSDLDRCAQCKYDLSGLGEWPVCPECGAAYTDKEPGPLDLVPRPERMRKLHALFVLDLILLASALVSDLLARHILAYRVHWSGYTWDVAWRYASRNTYGESEEPEGMVVWLLVLAVVVALLPRACRPVIGLVIIGAVVMAAQFGLV